MTGNDRRSPVLGIVRQSREPLDDDQLAAAAQMNRVYVNQLCRQLAAEGLVVRQRGGDGKLVNVATAGHPASAANPLPASQRLDYPGFLGGCDLWEGWGSWYPGSRIPLSCGNGQ